MAVVGKATRKPGSRRGPVESKSGVSYYETYVVRTNSVDDDGQVVVQANGLPRYGSAYPEDAAALVSLISPQQSSEHDMAWYVEVTWTHTAPGSAGSTPGNVMAMPPTWDWTEVPYQLFLEKDLDGKPYENTAGDPFDPPPLRLQYNLVLTVKMNRLSYNANEADQYLDAINSDVITVDGKTFPKFAGKIGSYSADMDFVGEVSYRKVVIVIEFNRKLWFPHKVLNKGPRHLVLGEEDSGPQLPRDSHGVTYYGEVFLDPQGYKLPEKDPGRWWIKFNEYRKLPFAPLNLPFG